MEIILGKRDYEITKTGKYPKYNLKQLNIFVDMDYPNYSAIETIFNTKSFDLFGKYSDEITKEEKDKLYEELKSEYGFHNVEINDFINWDKYEYDKEKKEFIEKIEETKKVAKT